MDVIELDELGTLTLGHLSAVVVRARGGRVTLVVPSDLAETKETLQKKARELHADGGRLTRCRKHRHNSGKSG